MEITIQNLQKKIKLNPPRIIRLIKTILNIKGLKRADLNIVFVTHQKIRAFNKMYLNKDCATDVLAFDLSEGHQSSIKSLKDRITDLRGDMMISTDAVLKNARVFRQPVEREFALYVIHGILHLLGYDDHQPKDIARMRAQEQELLDQVSLQTKRLICQSHDC